MMYASSSLIKAPIAYDGRAIALDARVIALDEHIISPMITL